MNNTVLTELFINREALAVHKHKMRAQSQTHAFDKQSHRCCSDREDVLSGKQIGQVMGSLVKHVSAVLFINF